VWWWVGQKKKDESDREGGAKRMNSLLIIIGRSCGSFRSISFCHSKQKLKKKKETRKKTVNQSKIECQFQ